MTQAGNPLHTYTLRALHLHQSNPQCARLLWLDLHQLPSPVCQIEFKAKGSKELCPVCQASAEPCPASQVCLSLPPPTPPARQESPHHPVRSTAGSPHGQTPRSCRVLDCNHGKSLRAHLTKQHKLTWEQDCQTHQRTICTRSRTACSLAPMYLLSNSGPFTDMKFAPLERANSAAIRVLPEPGIPYSTTPVCSFNGAFSNSSGY
ncbi:hypothetical protein B566_EDAN016005 [Ephemera danica]|nr:hypothetical protein B566_EDAN016005 [Ephemera danica]